MEIVYIIDFGIICRFKTKCVKSETLGLGVYKF